MNSGEQTLLPTSYLLLPTSTEGSVMSLYVLSSGLQEALAAGNPQRVLIEFYAKPDGTAYTDEEGLPKRVEFTNEDILMTEGIRLTSEFNSETDLTIGLCPSAQIRFSLLNDQSITSLPRWACSLPKGRTWYGRKSSKWTRTTR